MKKLLLLIVIFCCSVVQAKTMPAFYGELKHAAINERVTIAYYRFGQGKPLLMVNGHGDNMAMWHPQMLQQLAKKREIIIFDYPGVGESTIKGPYPDTMEQLASIVNQFIQNQKLQKPDVLGFSMGGSLTLYMMSQHGDHYGKIIAVGAKAGGKQTVLPEPKYFKMLDDTSMSPEQAIKTLLFPASAAKQADAYLQVISQLPQEKMDAKALQAQGRAVTRENKGEGIWQALPKVKNRVLIINGTDDVLTPVENAIRIASSIPASWLVRVAGAGHGVLFQKPDFSAQLILLFLQ